MKAVPALSQEGMDFSGTQRLFIQPLEGEAKVKVKVEVEVSGRDRRIVTDRSFLRRRLVKNATVSMVLLGFRTATP
jgi:hypothetical protein